MNKPIYRLLLALQLLWLIFATPPTVAVADGTISLPLDYYSFQPPAAGSSYTDASFGTSIKRLTNALATPDVAAGGNLTWAVNEYSSMSPFNKDNSRLLLIHDSYFALYDGSGTFLKNLPLEVHAGSEPRWSRSDANVFYFVNGNQLKQHNISSGATTVVHAFTEYSSISGKGESDICFDGNHFVFAGDGRYVFVYEISSGSKGPVFDAGGAGGFDQIYITPDDNVLIGWYAAGRNRYNGVELYDRSMRFLRQVATIIGHMDVTRDTNGNEVMVWVNAADPQPVCNNGIVKIRLSDGQQTCLASFDWSLATHVSAPDNNGWVFVETYAPSDPNPLSSAWKPYTNELLRVKLDGSQVVRLGHHRSRPFNSYQWQPKLSVSRDGSQLVYSSNFGLQAILGYPTEYSDVYLIADSSVTGTVSGGTTGGGTTGGGTTGGGTTGSTRIEEDNPAVTYSGGTWYSNSMSVHSGGSARLAVEAGARATFSFTGTSVSWLAYCDEWSGIANVYVDGVAKATVDTYASPSKSQFKMYSITGLTQAAHQLVIEVTGNKNASSGGAWIWVDAFEVGSATTGGGTTGGGTTGGGTTGGTTGSTRIEEDNPAVTYSGGTWYSNSMSVHSGGSAKLAVEAGARATFSFTGTSVSWLAYCDEWSGIANVYVDGVAKATVDTYASPSKSQFKMYSITGLAQAAHQLVIEVTGNHNASSGGSWIWVDAFETSSATTGGAPPPPALVGRIEQNNPAIAYSGTWLPYSLPVLSGGNAAISKTAGSRATLTFTGTSVTWIGYRDEWSGIARVYIDGSLVATIDLWTSPAMVQPPIYTKSWSAAGKHTIAIEATGRRNKRSGDLWVWIDAIDVKP